MNNPHVATASLSESSRAFHLFSSTWTRLHSDGLHIPSSCSDGPQLLGCRVLSRSPAQRRSGGGGGAAALEGTKGVPRNGGRK